MRLGCCGWFKKKNKQKNRINRQNQMTHCGGHHICIQSIKPLTRNIWNDTINIAQHYNSYDESFCMFSCWNDTSVSRRNAHCHIGLQLTRLASHIHEEQTHARTFRGPPHFFEYMICSSVPQRTMCCQETTLAGEERRYLASLQTRCRLRNTLYKCFYFRARGQKLCTIQVAFIDKMMTLFQLCRCCTPLQ